MKYFSTFSGIGGFELGIQQAYDNRPNLWNRDKNIQEGLPNTEKQQDWATCVGYSEIDKYAIQTYEKHFNHKNYGDISKINPKELPDFDLFVGGFPCQSFSIAGKRGGFEDTRGTMFFEIARIVREKQPQTLLLENVKGLLSHDKGRTFRTIISTLDELGYDCEWQVLNSKDFGVPQNRERVFIIGHLRGRSGRKVFPITRSSGLYTKEITQEVSDAQRIYTTSCAKTLKGEGGGQGAKTGLYAVLTPDRLNKRQNGRRIKDDGDPMFTLTAQDKHGILDKRGEKSWTVRRLTPLECERLQGFPDHWTEQGLDDIIELEIKITEQLCQNAEWKNVPLMSLLEVNSYASSTIKDGENGGILIQNIGKKEKTQEIANCVIDLPTVEKCVCDITNLGKDMATLYKLNETKNIEIITKQNLILESLEKKSTERLLKITLDENLRNQKLSIILTWIKEIMKFQIFTCAKTGQSITDVIIIWKKLEQSYTSEELSSLKMGSIVSISDTQRYKQCGNAVTVNVIKEIVLRLST